MLNPYLNFHRPCMFAEDTVDAKGKVKKRYPQRLVMTPLEKLASLPDPDTFLKPGITLAQLQAEATRLTDNDAAQQLNEARQRLFQPSTTDPSAVPDDSPPLLRSDSNLYWN